MAVDTEIEKRQLREMNARLELYYRSKGLVRSSFIGKVGTTQQKLQHGLDGTSGSADYLIKAQKLFPSLNLHWLLTGRGAMELEEKEDEYWLVTKYRAIDTEVGSILNMPDDSVTNKAKKVDAIAKLLPDLMHLRGLLDSAMRDHHLATIDAFMTTTNE